jgi:hypothetical protein
MSNWVGDGVMQCLWCEAFMRGRGGESWKYLFSYSYSLEERSERKSTKGARWQVDGHHGRTLEGQSMHRSTGKIPRPRLPHWGNHHMPIICSNLASQWQALTSSIYASQLHINLDVRNRNYRRYPPFRKYYKLL